MIEIKVKGCSDCPFCEFHRDDFAIGDSDLYICGLQRHMYYEQKKKEFSSSYFINNTIISNTPYGKKENCPLIDNSHLIALD